MTTSAIDRLRVIVQSTYDWPAEASLRDCDACGVSGATSSRNYVRLSLYIPLDAPRRPGESEDMFAERMETQACAAQASGILTPHHVRYLCPSCMERGLRRSLSHMDAGGFANEQFTQAAYATALVQSLLGNDRAAVGFATISEPGIAGRSMPTLFMAKTPLDCRRVVGEIRDRLATEGFSFDGPIAAS